MNRIIQAQLTGVGIVKNNTATAVMLQPIVLCMAVLQGTMLIVAE